MAIPQINEIDAMRLADPDCVECRGFGTVKHFIGHEGRGAIFPCKCLKRPNPLLASE